MKDQLFIEIEKFNKWAQQQFPSSQNDLGGEWECEYENWASIYNTFEDYIATTDSKQWTDDQKNKLLYIIARDNETEYLSNILNERALIILTEASIKKGSTNDKWQLAVQLHKLSDRQMALSFLDDFVNDDEEYVNRRALMELAKLQSDKIEFYAEKFWDKNRYGEMEEYQRIAVLYSLKTINSKQLGKYIEMAKQDGRKYLVENALKIESETNTPKQDNF